MYQSTHFNKLFFINANKIYNKLQDIKKISKCAYGAELNDLLNLITDNRNGLYDNFSFLGHDFLLFKLKYDKKLLDQDEVIHIGALATILDVASTVGVSAYDKTCRHNVSSKLSIQNIHPIKDEMTLIITCNKIEMVSNDIAICSSDVYDLDYKLLASSQHVKAFLKNTWSINY